MDLGGGLRRVYRYTEEPSLPLVATAHTYSSGGYLVDLPPRRRDAREVIAMMERDRFLSVETRLVLIEFALFNAPTNNFCIAQLSFEKLAAGGIVPGASIQTLRLLPYDSPNAGALWMLDVVLAAVLAAP